MGEEEDYSKFNPKEHWKETNNESSKGIYLSQKDLKKIKDIIQYLDIEHTLSEMQHHLKMNRQELIRLISHLQMIRHVILTRRQLKGCMGYHIQDSREIKNKFEFLNHLRTVYIQEKKTKFSLRPGFYD